MLIREIVYRVQSAYQKGVPSSSTRLRNRHIYSKIKTARSRVISQEKKKGQAISQFSYQTIPCIEMVEVPIHECPCIPPLGYCILRSKYKIPKTLTGADSDLIQSVTSLDGNIRYDPTTWQDVKYIKGNKYTGTDPNYFIRNDYLYLTTKKYPVVITITGIFDDPVEASDYPSYCGDESNCTPYMDREFPVEGDLVDAILELSFPELISIFNSNREDVTNNNTDNIIPETK